LDYVINTTTEKVNSIGGMAQVGKRLEKIGFCKNSGRATPRHPHVLKSIIGSLTYTAEKASETKINAIKSTTLQCTLEFVL